MHVLRYEFAALRFNPIPKAYFATARVCQPRSLTGCPPDSCPATRRVHRHLHSRHGTEEDYNNTPRLAAGHHLLEIPAWLGIVRRQALVVKDVSLQAGKVTYLATYEANDIQDTNWSEFDAMSADDAARRSWMAGRSSTWRSP